MTYSAVEANLARVRSKLDAVLRAVPEGDWKRKPAAGGWSVGEVVAHLIQVETAVLDAGVKRLAQPPRTLKSGWLPRSVWPPIWLIPYRGLKRQTPIPMDAALVASKTEMLETLAQRRQETLCFLRETLQPGRCLDGYFWNHPFFGSLTLLEWCRVLAYHETRHRKQIREIVSSFQS